MTDVATPTSKAPPAATADVAAITVVAKFTASYIPALANLLAVDDFDDADPIHRKFHGLQVEPNADGRGGVTLIATDGRVMVWINDRTGTATRPFVLDLCPKIVRACSPPPLPEQYDADGDLVTPPLPGSSVPWLVEVEASEHGLPDCRLWGMERPRGHCSVIVRAKEGPIIDSDDDDNTPELFVSASRTYAATQTIARKPLDWRSVLPKGGADVGRIGLGVDYLAKLAWFGSKAVFRFHGPLKAALVDFTDAEDVQAAIMPFELDKGNS